MRKLIAAVGLALVAGGCVHSHGAPASYAPPPLDAWFVSPEPELRFRASRPAYAAVFEIVPGVGTSLLYPSGRAGGPGAEGGLPGRVFEDAVHREGSAGGRPARNGWRAARSPRYLLLIASDYPLDLGDFVRDGYVSSAAAGDLGLSGGQPLDTMERLVEITVPWTGDDNTWTSDFYVEWPRDPRTPRRSTDVLVACNGYEVIVPDEYAAQLRRELCTAEAANPERTGGSPSDVTGSVGRPRPRPDSPVTTGGQGYRPRSRQLEQPGSRGPESRPAPGGRGRIEGGGAAEPAGSPRPSAPTPPEGRPGRARPATPASPNGAGTPATPATPANPNDAGTPATPATPADPNGAGTPATPATPADPRETGRPGRRATPAASDGGGQPTPPPTPVRPSSEGGRAAADRTSTSASTASADSAGAHGRAVPVDTMAPHPTPSVQTLPRAGAPGSAVRPSSRRAPSAGPSKPEPAGQRD